MPMLLALLPVRLAAYGASNVALQYHRLDYEDAIRRGRPGPGQSAIEPVAVKGAVDDGDHAEATDPKPPP